THGREGEQSRCAQGVLYELGHERGRVTRVVENEAQSEERHRERPHRPGKPGGDTHGPAPPLRLPLAAGLRVRNLMAGNLLAGRRLDSRLLNVHGYTPPWMPLPVWFSA